MLVIEGWVHEYAITADAEEFQTGAYHHLFTTGGPVTGQGGYLNDYNTSASIDARPAEKIRHTGQIGANDSLTCDWSPPYLQLPCCTPGLIYRT